MFEIFVITWLPHLVVDNTSKALRHTVTSLQGSMMNNQNGGYWYDSADDVKY